MRILTVSLRIALACALTMGALLDSSETAAQSVASVDARLDDAQGRLASLQERTAAARVRFAEAQERLRSLRAEIARASADVEQVAAHAARLRSRWENVARELYMGAGAESIETILSAKSVAEVESRFEYLGQSQSAYLDVFTELVRRRAELRVKVSELDEARNEAEGVRSEALAIRDELETEVAAQQQQVAQLSDELADARDRAAQRRARRVAAALVEAAREARLAEAEAERVASAAQQVSSPAPPAGSSDVDWDAIAQCESSGRWSLNARYDGGLQFHPDTWLAYGGGRYARYAYQASREQQIAIAERVLDAQGPDAWPNCFRYG